MGHCEVGVRYRDDSAGSFCLVADSGGVYQLIVPQDVVEIIWLRFAEDSGSSGEFQGA